MENGELLMKSRLKQKVLIEYGRINWGVGEGFDKYRAVIWTCLG